MKHIQLINQLGGIRKIPQFLYYGDISGRNTCIFRQEMMKNFPNFKEKGEEIDFILHSPGGSPSNAYRIIKILHQYYKKVNIIVPFWAKSAATLLSLGGDEIIMDELAEFGPLDTQIGTEKSDGSFLRESALNDESSVRQIEELSQQRFFSMFHTAFNGKRIRINKSELSNQILEHVAQFYQPLMNKIDPYKLGEKRRYLDVAKMYANLILTQYSSITQENQEILIDYLVYRCPDHGFIIDYTLLKAFGLPVNLSSNVSNEYSDILTKLSLIFMEQELKDYIGFIAEENNNEDLVNKKSEADIGQE